MQYCEFCEMFLKNGILDLGRTGTPLPKEQRADSDLYLMMYEMVEKTQKKLSL